MADMLKPEVRRRISQAGGRALWSSLTDREARAAHTAPGRKAAWDRFERQVDPDGSLPPEVRARRADEARREYYRDIGRLGAKARWARRTNGGGAGDGR
ncbi:MAG TPA: hypothetical protein VIL54_09805 [Natronosporangium sp.]